MVTDKRMSADLGWNQTFCTIHLVGDYHYSTSKVQGKVYRWARNRKDNVPLTERLRILFLRLNRTYRSERAIKQLIGSVKGWFRWWWLREMLMSKWMWNIDWSSHWVRRWCRWNRRRMGRWSIVGCRCSWTLEAFGIIVDEQKFTGRFVTSGFVEFILIDMI